MITFCFIEVLESIPTFGIGVVAPDWKIIDVFVGEHTDPLNFGQGIILKRTEVSKYMSLHMLVMKHLIAWFP